MEQAYERISNPVPNPAYGDFVAAMVAPMTWAGETRGVIGVGTRDRRRTFTDADADVLTTFATLASLALRNAESFEERERQARVESGFSRIASLLGEPVSLSATLEAVALAATEAFAADVAAVLMPAPEGYRLAGAHDLPETLRAAFADGLPAGAEVLEHAAPRARRSPRRARGRRALRRVVPGCGGRRVAARDPARPAAPRAARACTRPLPRAASLHRRRPRPGGAAGGALEGGARPQRALRGRAAVEAARPAARRHRQPLLGRARARSGAGRGRRAGAGAAARGCLADPAARGRRARRRRGSRRRRGRDRGLASAGRLAAGRDRRQLAGAGRHPRGCRRRGAARRRAAARRAATPRTSPCRSSAPRASSRACSRCFPAGSGPGRRRRSRPSSRLPRTPRSPTRRPSCTSRSRSSGSAASPSSATSPTASSPSTATSPSCSGTRRPSGSPASCRGGARAERARGAPARAALGERVGPGDRLVPIRRADNEVWLSLTEAVMRDPSGETAGRIFAFRDISAERVVEQMRSDFVSTVSHELRAPLTSIYGFAATLLREDVRVRGRRAADLPHLHRERGAAADDDRRQAAQRREARRRRPPARDRAGRRPVGRLRGGRRRARGSGARP